MKQKHDNYQLILYPKMRRWMAVTFRPAQHKPIMHGLIEVDVTRARAFLRDHKWRSGDEKESRWI